MNNKWAVLVYDKYKSGMDTQDGIKLNIVVINVVIHLKLWARWAEIKKSEHVVYI